MISRCDTSASPAISLIAPGAYHFLRGDVGAAFGWIILFLFVSPTVIGGVIVLLFCYRSALRLSKIA